MGTIITVAKYSNGYPLTSTNIRTANAPEEESVAINVASRKSTTSEWNK